MKIEDLKTRTYEVDGYITRLQGDQNPLTNHALQKLMDAEGWVKECLEVAVRLMTACGQEQTRAQDDVMAFLVGSLVTTCGAQAHMAGLEFSPTEFGVMCTTVAETLMPLLAEARRAANAGATSDEAAKNIAAKFMDELKRT